MQIKPLKVLKTTLETITEPTISYAIGRNICYCESAIDHADKALQKAITNYWKSENGLAVQWYKSTIQGNFILDDKGQRIKCLKDDKFDDAIPAFKTEEAIGYEDMMEQYDEAEHEIKFHAIPNATIQALAAEGKLTAIQISKLIGTITPDE